MTATIHVTDGDRKRQGQLSGVFQFDSKQNATTGGSFILDCYADDNYVPLLRDLPDSGIEVVNNTTGIVEFEGWVTEWTQKLSPAQPAVVVFKGINLLAELDATDLRPESTKVSPPFLTAYTTITGSVTEVIVGMVNAHAGQGAPLERRKFIVPAATPAGPNVTKRTRFRQTLAEWVEDMCNAYSMVPKVELVGGNLEFSVAPAPVRPSAIVGPSIGNLTAYSFGWKRPTATTGIVGGQGELTARAFAQADNTPSTRWTRRIETYQEHTEIDNPAQLDQAAVELVETAVERVHFTAEIAAYETDQIRYGRDFSLGDIVPVRFGDQQVDAQITQTEIEILPGKPFRRDMTVGIAPEDGFALGIAAARRADRTARMNRGA